MIETKRLNQKDRRIKAEPSPTPTPTDEQIDRALEQTFPASDPFSFHSDKDAPEYLGLTEPAATADAKHKGGDHR